jgi:gamma-glutamylcyclotransferase (GGCT)/AIG2-like uncharacterized protein YtfP
MFLFVYGSLLRGLHNHRCLRTEEPDGAKFVKEDMINGQLYSNGAYPFLYLAPTNEFVKGEIYEVENLENCDRLESYREDRPESENLFNRRIVKSVSGETVYVYEGGDRFIKHLPNFTRVESNDWKSFFNQTQLEQACGFQAEISDSWLEIDDILDNDEPENQRLRNIIRKIFKNKTLPAKKIDELFQRNVTKAQLIQCIILLVNTVDELV